MSRFKNRTSQFLIDVSVLMLAFFLAMLVRFDWNVPPVMFRKLLIVLPYVVLLQYAFLSAFGVTRFSWRFISLRDVVRILAAVASASAGLLALRLVTPALVESVPRTATVRALDDCALLTLEKDDFDRRVGKSLALGMVRPELSAIGTELEMEWSVEGERGSIGAEVVELPFFDPARKRE